MRRITRFANDMGSILERARIISLSEHASRLFGVVWRVSMVLLPWQTRWFLEGSTLGGFPWEWGRVSVYVSWIPIILSIILFLVSRLSEALRARTTLSGLGSLLRGNDRKKMGTLLAMLLLFLGSVISSIYLRATLQWWVEALLLMGFAWVTVRGIDRETICRWVVYAVLPHALLGIVQFCTQWVVGSKWLGIAAQDPMVPGVSVIESMGRRWLRAYGGFPHPNIFGGWLVIGLVSSIKERVSGIEYRVSSIITLATFSVSLVLTFSRSAWLGFGFLIGGIILFLFKQWRATREVDRFRWSLPFVAMIVFAMTMIWQGPLVMTRSSSVTRLEAISVNERRVGIENGMEVFRRHPWFGVGPRATGYALIEEGVVSVKTIPIIPHNVFVLVVGEVGLFGCLLLVLVLRSERQWIKDALRNDRERMRLLLPVFVILCLDHYPWSTWSGMVWTMLVFCLIFAKKGILDTSPDRLAMYEQRN